MDKEERFFVTRIKKNAVYRVIEVLRVHEREKGKAMVLREEIMELEYFPENEDGKQQTKNKEALRLKKVCYQNEQNRYFEFISNSMDSTAEEVAFLYRKRWGIELLFKKMKQNFPLHYFYGENENAIRTQVWCMLIAQLLMTIIPKMANTKKVFSVVATLVRIHLISLLDVYALLRSPKREYIKNRGRPSLHGQLQLLF